MTVERKEKKVGSEVKIERHVTLYNYGRNDDGDVDLEKLQYQIEGRANMKYDRIKWDNGCVWCRYGASGREKDAIKHGRDSKVMVEDQDKGSAPPDWDAIDKAQAQKVFQPAARHEAAPPDLCPARAAVWTLDEKLAEIHRVMMEQMEAVDGQMEKAWQEKARREEQARIDGADCEDEARNSRVIRLATEAVHAAPPPPVLLQDEDTEAEAAGAKVLVPDGEHKMFCCGALCGKNPAVMDEADEELLPENVPEARDMEKEGFFGADELEDVIDRINDVIGVWGVSEETEREYIKPPVVAMNKIVASAMNAFMNNPLMDLISYLMDEAMDFGVKCMKIGHYIKENFVDPLCTALVDKLQDFFAGITWIKNQVTKVILMMSQMVTDQVVGKCVEQIGDSDVVD